MNASRYIAVSLTALAGLAGACSSDSAGGDSTDGGTAGAASGSGGLGGGAGTNSAGANNTAGTSSAGANSTATVGSFTVLLEQRSAITKVSGVVRDGPAIEAVPYVVSREEAPCRLLVPDLPFCDPACTSDRVCMVGDICVTRPVSHSVGTVTVRGLATADGSNQFTMAPVGSSKAYGPSSSVSIQYPPTQPGALVELSADGGDFAPFQLQTLGIAPISGFTGDPLPLKSGQPLPLMWTAQPGAQVEVVLEIAHHGGARGKIVCAAEDTGSLTIPSTLVTELIGLGVAGFPDVTLTRKSASSTQIAVGRVEFVIFASQSRPIAIEGLTSCMSDDDCPEGQRCGQDKACAAS